MQLYIHVPFCAKKCHYCSFYSIPTSSLNILESFKPSLQFINRSLNIVSNSTSLQTKKNSQSQTVQSLSSFLTGKEIEKKSNITITNSAPTTTLADAFLSKEQADALRQKLGISEFSPIIPVEKKVERLKLPKGFCHHFREEHPLLQSPEFELWKTTILKELSILAEFYGNTPVTSIFFGGGTPSYIPLASIEQVLFFIIGKFSVLSNAEITLECNPESLSNPKAVAYQKMGFNRASLGVQSLNNEYLSLMGRPHSALQAQQAYHYLRSAGFDNISLDFIWAVPTQRLKTWVDDIKSAIKLEPEHISAYGLSIEEGSYFDLLEQEGKLKLASEQEQAQMYKTGSALLEEAGYMQYEISNYAKMGYQCQHNLGYWLGNDYLGVGPTGASTTKNIRRTNTANLEEWAIDVNTVLAEDMQKLSKLENTNTLTFNTSAKYTIEILSHAEQICELVMLQLRTSKGLLMSEYQNLTGNTFMRDFGKLIQVLDKNNLMRIKNGYAYFTRNGMLVSNSILEHFLNAIHAKYDLKALDSPCKQ